MKLNWEKLYLLIFLGFSLIFAGCYGTSATVGGGRIDSPAGILIIKDESLNPSDSTQSQATNNSEYVIGFIKKDGSIFTEDEFNKIMAQKFYLEDTKGTQYQLAYSSLYDDDFQLLLGFIVPKSVTGFKLLYASNNPIILRY